MMNSEDDCNVTVRLKSCLSLSMLFCVFGTQQRVTTSSCVDDFGTSTECFSCCQFSSVCMYGKVILTPAGFRQLL